jgi:hypothetical protein
MKSPRYWGVKEYISLAVFSLSIASLISLAYFIQKPLHDVRRSRAADNGGKYDGELIQNVMVGKDAYCRYPYVEGNSDCVEGDDQWKKFPNWVDYTGLGVLGVTKVYAYNVRHNEASEIYPDTLQETVIFGRDAYIRFPYINENDWNHFKKIPNWVGDIEKDNSLPSGTITKVDGLDYVIWLNNYTG